MKERVLHEVKKQATQQGARADYRQADAMDLSQLLDPFQAMNNDIHFQNTCLDDHNPNAGAARAFGAAMDRLGHLDLSDLASPMPSLQGHPSVGSLLTSGVHFVENRSVRDYHYLQSGTLMQRVEAVNDMMTAASLLIPVAEVGGLAVRAGAELISEGASLLMNSARSARSIGLFGSRAASRTAFSATTLHADIVAMEGRSITANQVAINASRPGEIAYGYGELSVRQSKILDRLPNSGRFIQLHKSHINLTDLSALTAKTGDEFALFTLGAERIVVRGTASGLRMPTGLGDKLLSQGYHWSAHTHPGLSDRVLMASGTPGDRATLQLFNQSRSVILNSMGRQSIFDLENDYLITKASQASVPFSAPRLGY